MLSPAAKRHFKLFRDPFQNEISSDADVFFDCEQRYISESMFLKAKHGGILAVIGESGSGKSTLRKLLLQRLRNESVRVIFPQMIDKTKLSSRHIDEAIILDLAPGERIRSSAETRERQAREFLTADSNLRSVLIIEEAHNLSIATIKHLKCYYEIEDGYVSPLSVILIGQPELKYKLDENRYPMAREVIRRCEIAELLPLGEALEKYLAHKFKRISVDPATIFAADAYDAIRARWTKAKPGSKDLLSQLYPLVANNTVTRAMNRAAEIGVPLITGDLIKEL